MNPATVPLPPARTILPRHGGGRLRQRRTVRAALAATIGRTFTTCSHKESWVCQDCR